MVEAQLARPNSKYTFLEESHSTSSIESACLLYCMETSFCRALGLLHMRGVSRGVGRPERKTRKHSWRGVSELVRKDSANAAEGAGSRSEGMEMSG